jgi:hypothetical protein
LNTPARESEKVGGVTLAEVDGDVMDELSGAIQNLPLAGLIPVVLLLLVGVVLWAAGRKVLRAGFAAAGLIVGGGIGWIVADASGIGLAPWIPALVLGIILACVAALGYRVAVAGALALVIGVAAPLAVGTIAEIQGVENSMLRSEPVQEPEEGEGSQSAPEDDPADWLEDDESPLLGGDIDDEDLRTHLLGDDFEMTEREEEMIEDARSFAQQLADGIKAWWAERPERLRPMILGAAVLGILFGVLIGALAPIASASVVTAFGGSLLWLTSLRIALVQFGEPIAGWLPRGATALLIIWVVVALIGVTIQWIFRPKPADKAD